MKTLELNSDSVAVRLSEFELMALAALVEQAQEILPLQHNDDDCVRSAVHKVADEFRSLLAHFALTADIQ